MDGDRRPIRTAALTMTTPVTHGKETTVLRAVDAIADEMVAFLQGLVRIPTVNPPGEEYAAGANFIAAKLQELGYDIQLVVADDRPEHTPTHPRVNVIGRMNGSPARPLLHFNGHFDVVPVGDGWTVEPFGAVVR